MCSILSSLVSMPKPSQASKKRKANEMSDTHIDALATSLDKAANPSMTEQTSRSLQDVHGLSMAPYTASELAHFSHERLVRYITDLQEQVGTAKTKKEVDQVGTVKTETRDEAAGEPVSTPEKPIERSGGLPFFGDADPGIGFEQEKAFHQEVMQTRATMKKKMLEHFERKYRNRLPACFAIKVQSRRVIEEIFHFEQFGPCMSKGTFFYDLDVSPTA